MWRCGHNTKGIMWRCGHIAILTGLGVGASRRLRPCRDVLKTLLTQYTGKNGGRRVRHSLRHDLGTFY